MSNSNMPVVESTEEVIEVIRKPTDKRLEADITSVVWWLRRRAPILRKIKKDAVSEIVKCCQYVRVAQDDIIVQQGDHADCGSALAYMDTSVPGDDATVLPSVTNSAGQTEVPATDRRPRNKLSERPGLGKYVVRFATGDHFGDMSMLSKEKLRSKTIVADVICDLIVIGENLFEKILKDVQLKEYDQMCYFVNSHPYFAHLPPKLKNLLELSLRRESYSFEETIVRQGAPVKELYFLLEGQADMYVEAHKYQKEYAKFWPFETSIDLYFQEFEFLRKAREQAILRKYRNPGALLVKSGRRSIKANQGYAAAEKMDRPVCLCTVYAGEVIGDLEIVESLGTYLSTVVCTAPTTVFVLGIKNLERLTGKRNPITMQLMKHQVKEKLEIRTLLYSGRDITFLSYLLFKINEEDSPLMGNSKLPPIKTSKYLPEKHIQFQHLLEKFKDGHAQLIQPRVPGALIFKEQMQQKAQIRANVRLRGLNISGRLREVRQTIAKRKPRSRREIVKFLKESLESRVRDYKQVHRNKVKSASIPLSQQTEQVPVPDLNERKDHVEVSSESKQVNIQDNDLDTHGHEGSEHFKDERNTETISFVEEKSSSHIDQSQPRNAKESLVPSMERHNSILTEEISKRDISEHNTLVNASFPAVDVNKNAAEKEILTKSVSLSIADEIQSGIFNMHSSLLSLNKLAAKDSGNQTKRELGVRHANSRVQASVEEQITWQETGFQDLETSDNNLSILENRIKAFFSDNDQSGKLSRKPGLFVPKLRRFHIEHDNSETLQPRPGGKVWVRKSPCQHASSSFKVNDHEHVRHHIVSELPKFTHVQKSRIILPHTLPGTLAGWMSENQY